MPGAVTSHPVITVATSNRVRTVPMRLDDILRFIIPLTFMAFWAWTSTLSRDGQRWPPRQRRRPNRMSLTPSNRSRSWLAPDNQGGRSRWNHAGPQDSMWDRDLDG